MIHIRVCGPAAGIGTVVAIGVLVVACSGATFVVGVEEGAWARVVDVVDEADVVDDDEIEVVEEVVVDGGGSVVVVAGVEVTGDDVVVWA